MGRIRSVPSPPGLSQAQGLPATSKLLAGSEGACVELLRHMGGETEAWRDPEAQAQPGALAAGSCCPFPRILASRPGAVGGR